MRGITLIEALIAIAIFAILLTLAIPPLNRWRIRSSIEGDTKDIYALIQKARAVAFTRKVDLTVQANSNRVCIYQGTVQLECLSLNNNFSGSVGISRRGYFSSSGSIRYTGSANVNPNYNCVVASLNRVRLGVWNGSECTAK